MIKKYYFKNIDEVMKSIEKDFKEEDLTANNFSIDSDYDYVSIDFDIIRKDYNYLDNSDIDFIIDTLRDYFDDYRFEIKRKDNQIVCEVLETSTGDIWIK